MDAKTLSAKVALELGISSEETQRLFDALANAIVDHCGKMDTIAIPGFGNFEARKRDERIAVNIQTGRKMLYPPKVLLTFRPSTILKKSVREGGTQQ